MNTIDDPSRAAVVVVAVERCNLFAGDSLRGPVADAIRWVEWAEAVGVPPERIRLFISAKPASNELLDAWRARRRREDEGKAVKRPDIRCSDATRDNIVNFLTGSDGSGLSELEPAAPATLLIAWSGHGVVDSHSENRDRQLFFEDAEPKFARHMSVSRLSSSINARSRKFERRLLVIAACATPAASSFRQRGSMGDPESLGDLGDIAVRGRQYTMAATLPGNAEVNPAGPDGIERSRFLTRLFEQLGAPVKGRWPDLVAALERTKAAFPQHEAPASWLWGDGTTELSTEGADVIGSERATRLARALRQSGLKPELMRSAFAAASPDKFGALARLHEAGQSPADLVALLEESPIAGDQHDPLRRMAFEAFARMPQGSAAVADWLRGDGVDDTEATARVAECRQPAPAPRFLLIDGMPIDGVTDGIHAWLFTTPDARSLPVVRDDGQPFAIDADHRWPDVLAEIFDVALSMSEHPDAPLIVELAIPRPQLDTPGLEAQHLAEAGDELPLRERYLVVRRLAERMRTLQDGGSRQRQQAGWGTQVAAWRTVANALRPRLAQSGLRLIALAPSALVAGGFAEAMSQQVDGSCVHVDGGWDGERLCADAVRGLVRAATPYASWATGAWCPADATLLETSLAGKRGEDVLVALHAVQQQNGHPSTRLVLLWDDPVRYPASHRLGIS